MSLRELRELRVFFLRLAWLSNKRIEKNKQTNIILIDWRIKNEFFFLALSYSTQPYIAVHYSNEGKIFTFSSTIATLFFICSSAKNNFLAPLLVVL